MRIYPLMDRWEQARQMPRPLPNLPSNDDHQRCPLCKTVVYGIRWKLHHGLVPHWRCNRCRKWFTTGEHRVCKPWWTHQKGGHRPDGWVPEPVFNR